MYLMANEPNPDECDATDDAKRTFRRAPKSIEQTVHESLRIRLFLEIFAVAITQSFACFEIYIFTANYIRTLCVE